MPLQAIKISENVLHPMREWLGFSVAGVGGNATIEFYRQIDTAANKLFSRLYITDGKTEALMFSEEMSVNPGVYVKVLAGSGLFEGYLYEGRVK